ncbi:hypothetical protein [Streptomyces sp. H27-H5]|uniref:hypothetical protein n=1 Tax=Streptomyces sp. H27-H5 TaxID=2996460 RepID=UPI00226F446D|nr:hypothetical protein [Streptomyces sp. H27-H5]MCY0961571.1 hypothetical protein [Streptomyces sp. H27-H5]
MADQPPPLPTEPADCRRRAEEDGPSGERLVWALLAVAGELADLRRLLAKRR